MRTSVIFLVLLGAFGAALTGLLASFGQFETVERDFAGQCAPVTGLVGPEDIAIDRRRGVAFVTTLDRRDGAARGGVHIVDPADPLAAQGWRDATEGAPEKFLPLGLDYFEAGEVRRLFVVNEAVPGVELYDVGEEGKFIHRATLMERRLTSPNNIVATGPDSFYVTNDVKSGRNTLMGNLQFLARAANGQILQYRRGVWSLAAENLRFANGVALSGDGARLYVAETTGKAVRIYARDRQTGALSLEQTLALPFAPDNLSVDAEGDVWVAGLPKPLTVPRHKADPDNLAPSEIARIGADGAIASIYRDDGSEISAATVAAHFGGKLMIGALYEDKFLLCDLPRGEI